MVVQKTAELFSMTTSVVSDELIRVRTGAFIESVDDFTRLDVRFVILPYAIIIISVLIQWLVAFKNKNKIRMNLFDVASLYSALASSSYGETFRKMPDAVSYFGAKEKIRGEFRLIRETVYGI